MGRLFLGLVLAGGLLAATGPQQAAAGPAVTAVPARASTQASTQASTPVQAKPDACGRKPAPKPNGKQWQCTLAENFNGRKLNRELWMVFRDTEPARKSTSCRKARNVVVKGGQLRLRVAKNKGRKCRYTSASISTHHRWSQKYGRFEARIKVQGTKERGLQESFWLWPDDRVESDVKWPAAGEIDIVETYSQYPNLAVPFLHYTSNDNGGPKPGLNTAWDCKAHRGRWHVYTLLWGPKRIEIRVDRKPCLVNSSGDRAFKKKYIVALTAALGIHRNKVNDDTPLPAKMLVDYVKVWR
jgi:beta-glucanase (GH16 family)